MGSFEVVGSNLKQHVEFWGATDVSLTKAPEVATLKTLSGLGTQPCGGFARDWTAPVTQRLVRILPGTSVLTGVQLWLYWTHEKRDLKTVFTHIVISASDLRDASTGSQTQGNCLQPHLLQSLNVSLFRLYRYQTNDVIMEWHQYFRLIQSDQSPVLNLLKNKRFKRTTEKQQLKLFLHVCMCVSCCCPPTWMMAVM